MARYTWQTLLSLYEKLRISERIAFRNLEEYVELPAEASEPLKMLKAVTDLYHVVKAILRRMQRTVLEDVRLVTESLRGRVVTNLMARYMPSCIPVRVTTMSIETPANILLAVTVLEIYEALRRVRREIEEIGASRAMGPLKEYVLRRLDELISICSSILTDPTVRALIPAARMVMMEGRVDDVERVVRYEVRVRPREYQQYLKLLEFRERMRESLKALKRLKSGFKRSLVLDLSGEKLYEIFCFTLLLKSISERVEVIRADVDERGQIIRLKLPEFEIDIAYNAIPAGVQSRVQLAKARGLLRDSVNVERLGGLPDTIILIRNRNLRRVVIDYKYTDDVSYIIQSRFKALAYLYEFDAETSVIISKPPKRADYLDEEVMDCRGFYEAIANHGGAEVEFNGNRFVIAYVNPSEDSMEVNTNVMGRLVDFVLGLRDS